MGRAFLRVIKMGLVDFWRNRWLSLAATVMMAMTIFTIALFVLLNVSINQTAKTLQDKIDIAVYFKNEAPDNQIFELQNLLKSRDDVKEVQYISHEEALKRFRDRSKYRNTVQALLDQGFGSKLPRSLSVKATDPKYLDAIAAFIQQPPYDTMIESISHQETKALIDKYIQTTNFVKQTSLILSILFTAIAILIIYNTISMTIFTRKEEIGIMQLVGATAWYIKFPFILEGMMYGALATIITTIVLLAGVRGAAPSITNYINSPGFDFEQFFLVFLPLITALELLVGVVIGGLCSYLAVRKQLK